ncbi:MAG: hypothetical protein SV487_09070, partial [Thermodesulfobacteriota bacterium]|nr:hypothetical protein [Thermodesulfobacteriota bacterium]
KAAWWAALILPAMLIWAAPALGLSTDEAKALKQAGFSEQTISDLSALGRDQKRKRKPSLTLDEVKKLAEAGFPDDLIQTFIRLDMVTRHLDRPVITPAQARDLKASGVSLETIGLMFHSEINQALAASSSPKTGAARMGREVTTRSDGRRVIVYYSGDPKAPRPSPSRYREEDLRRAYELLEKLKLHIYYPQGR